MVHHLEIIQTSHRLLLISLLVVVKKLLLGRQLEEAVSLHGEFQVENRGVEICVLVPSALKQSFFEGMVAFTDEYFGLLA